MEFIQNLFIPVPMCLNINEICNVQGLFEVFRVIEVNGSQVLLSVKYKRPMKNAGYIKNGIEQ